MRSLYILALYLVFIVRAHAQAAPEIEWQRNLGGSQVETGASIEQTSDGGYVLCGTTYSNNADVSGNHGNGDIWVVKLSATGNTEWQRCLGGSQPDIGERILELPGGGYLVLGSTRSNDDDVSGNHGAEDVWLARLGVDGTPEWQRCYGGSLSDVPFAFEATPDGGYVIAGESRSTNGDLTTNAGFTDYWVVKLDANLDIQWQHTHGGSGGETAYALAVAMDGGYILNGYTDSNDGDVIGVHGAGDYWVVKLNVSGDIEWQRPCGGSGVEYGFAIMEMNDGSFTAVGASNSQDGDLTDPLGLNDFWVIKLSAIGEVIENRTFGGSGGDSGNDLVAVPAGGVVFCGASASSDGDINDNHGMSDAWLFRTDTSGNILWNSTFGGSQSDSFSRLRTLVDGSYIALGSSNSTNGDLTGNNGGTDVWVVKLGVDPQSVDEVSVLTAIDLYPNPCGERLHFSEPFPLEQSSKWQIIDAQGRVTTTGSVSYPMAPIDVSGLAQGAYTLVLQTQVHSLSTSFVKE